MTRPYSIPHCAPLYPELPYHYRDVRKISVYVRCDPAALAAFLPPEFELLGDVCEVFVMIAPDAGPLGHYTEAGVVIPCRYGDIIGAHVALEYVSSDNSLTAGREIWGYPKKMAEVDLDETQNGGFSGRVVRRDQTLISVEFTPQAVEFEKPQLHPRLQIKTFAAANGNGMDFYQVVRNNLSDLTVTERITGTAKLTLGNSAGDPLNKLGVLEVVGAEVTKTEFLLTTGEILADLNEAG